MKSYLTNRVQLCKTNSSFGESEKAPAAVPKSSVLGLLLFNIFINDIFLILKECDLANMPVICKMIVPCKHLIKAFQIS